MMIISNFETEIINTQNLLIEGDEDVILKFGPLSQPISKLFEDGWYLTTCRYKHYNMTSLAKIRLYLRKDKESYRVGNLTPNDFKTLTSLIPFLKIKGCMPQVLKSKDMSVNDMLDKLTELYPVKHKPLKTKIVGNMTFKEYVTTELRSRDIG